MNISPRPSESEDGSYDVVSSQVSNNGEAGKEEDLTASKVTARPRKEGDEDEEDSDWE